MSFAGPGGLLLERRSCLAAPEHPAPSRAEPHVVVPIGPDFKPSDVPACCEDIRVAAAGEDVDVVCDASSLVDPDLGTIDGLARLALAIRRLGYDIRLDPAPCELAGLLVLVGLADVVPCAEQVQPAGSAQPAGSVVEARRQPEHREELRGVEEEDDPADAPA
jgi:hypothetical protein